MNYHDLDHSSNNSAQIYIFRVWQQLRVSVHLERCNSESVTFKMNSRFFKLCRVYSNSLKMSNVGKFPWR